MSETHSLSAPEGGRINVIPCPCGDCGRTDDQVEVIDLDPHIDQDFLATSFLSPRQMCKRLGISPSLYTYHRRKGYLPHPPYRLNGKSYYHTDSPDYLALKLYFGQRHRRRHRRVGFRLLYDRLERQWC